MNWSMVTGATGGLGAAMARLIAAEGRPLILSGRDAHRLQSLAEELREAHGVEVRAVPADLATEEGQSFIMELLATARVVNVHMSAPGSTLGLVRRGRLQGKAKHPRTLRTAEAPLGPPGPRREPPQWFDPSGASEGPERQSGHGLLPARDQVV